MQYRERLTSMRDRAVQGDSGYRSNSNLEQISDWLTKILVGVGLVQIGQIGTAGGRLVRFLAPGLGGQPSSEAFAAALLVFFTTTGFLIGYLITRIFLGPVFARTENVIKEGEKPSIGSRNIKEPEKPTGGSIRIDAASRTQSEQTRTNGRRSARGPSTSPKRKVSQRG